jgi:hypothetical protein
MLNLIFHFAVGTLGSLCVSLVFYKLSGVERFSMPFGIIIIGISCASLAHFVSPWATPAVLLLYALVSTHEYQQDRVAAKNQ